MFCTYYYPTLGSAEIDIRLERDGLSADGTLDILLLEPEGSYTVSCNFKVPRDIVQS